MRLTSYAKYIGFDSATTLTEAQVNSYADVCSAKIENYLNRNLSLTTNIESHWCDESNVVLLNQYPVRDIYFVTQSVAEYGNIRTKDISMPVQIQCNGTVVNVIYGLGTIKTVFTLATYNTMQLMFDAITADINTKTGGVCEIKLGSDYASVSPLYLSNINYTSGSRTGIFAFFGYDLSDNISYTLEADRVLHFNRIMRAGSNAIMVRYQSGYVDVDALPALIVDVCNRMIKDISDYDANYESNQYQREKLGNAEFAKWDTNDKSNTGTLINRYKEQLSYYKVYDIAWR